MARQFQIQELLIKHQRRLQKLQEKEATLGINTPPETLIEIEDIEAQIEQLQDQLKDFHQKHKDEPNVFAQKLDIKIKFGDILPIRFLTTKLGIRGIIGVFVIGLIGISIFWYLEIHNRLKTFVATQIAEAALIETGKPVIETVLPKTIPTAMVLGDVQIEQLLISSSVKNYRVEITAKNNSSFERLIKRIVLSADANRCLTISPPDYPSAEELMTTYVISNVKLLTTDNGNTLIFNAEVSSQEDQEYTYQATGYGKVYSYSNCATIAFNFGFNTDLIIPPNQFSKYHLQIPLVSKAESLTQSLQSLILDPTYYEDICLTMETDLENVTECAVLHQ